MIDVTRLLGLIQQSPRPGEVPNQHRQPAKPASADRGFKQESVPGGQTPAQP